MVREVRLFLTVLFACVMTVVLFKTDREWDGIRFADARIRLDTGEYHGGSCPWDRAVGLLPYAYFRKWEKPEGVISRWEPLQYDRRNFRLSILLAGLCGCPVGLAICRCLHPWNVKPPSAPMQSIQTVTAGSKPVSDGG
jgi:hypothetical protein